MPSALHSQFFAEEDYDSAERSYAAILALLKDESANAQISGVTRARAISGMRTFELSPPQTRLPLTFCRPWLGSLPASQRVGVV